MADGARHRGVIHEKATGQVFHPDSLVRVEFKGCEGNTYRYLATSDTVSDTSRGFEEIGREKIVEHGKMKGEIVLESYSVKTVTAEIARCLVRGPDMKVTGIKSPEETQFLARWLAMKRAGDWGQIEHCKQNGCTFVTDDKVAYMFAIVRDVPAMLLVHDASLKGFCDRVMYSYVMFSDPQTAYGLKSVKNLKTQDGGSFRHVAAAAALAAVIVLMSFIQ